jgi:hypothetical protein
MWKKKKVLIIALLATVVVAGSIGGVVIAQAAGSTATGNATQPQTLLSRVAGILGIDQTKLQAAVTQAQGDMQLQALTNRLQKLVDNKTITQAQSDAYLKWYQSKPSTAPFQQQLKDWQQARPTIPPDLKNWQQAQPKIPGMPGGPGVPGGQIPRGRGMMNGKAGIGERGMMGGLGGRGGMMGGLALPAGPTQ